MHPAALNHYVRDRVGRLPGAAGSYSQGAPRAGLNPWEAVRRDIAFGAAVSWQGIRASGDQHGPHPDGYDMVPTCSSGTDGLPERTGQPRPGAILAVPDEVDGVDGMTLARVGDPPVTPQPATRHSEQALPTHS